MQDQLIDKEIFHVAGDAPDPTGGALRGVAATHDFTRTAAGHPLCHYSFGTGGEMIVEADVYRFPDQPIYVHLLCPHCAARGQTNSLQIRGDAKPIDYDPHGFVRTFPGWTDAQMASKFPKGTGGRLSIGRFKCTWEVDPTQRVKYGLAVCDFEAVIENNVVRRITSGELYTPFR